MLLLKITIFKRNLNIPLLIFLKKFNDLIITDSNFILQYSKTYKIILNTNEEIQSIKSRL